MSDARNDLLEQQSTPIPKPSKMASAMAQHCLAQHCSEEFVVSFDAFNLCFGKNGCKRPYSHVLDFTITVNVQLTSVLTLSTGSLRWSTVRRLLLLLLLRWMRLWRPRSIHLLCRVRCRLWRCCWCCLTRCCCCYRRRLRPRPRHCIDCLVLCNQTVMHLANR